jgi:hypothetical protein
MALIIPGQTSLACSYVLHLVRTCIQAMSACVNVHSFVPVVACILTVVWQKHRKQALQARLVCSFMRRAWHGCCFIAAAPFLFKYVEHVCYC